MTTEVSSHVEIRPFDRIEASDGEYKALTEVRNRFTEESTPDDPPSSLENTKNQLRNVPPIFELHMWAAWDGSRMVGTANVGIPKMDTNQHLAQFDITVLPEYRRRGLGTRFLGPMVEVAEREDRRLLIANTYSSVPAGEKFMETLGGNIGLSMRRNDLLISDLDRNLVSSWIDRAQERAAGFEIREFVGPYPESILGQVSELQRAINNMPRDTLELEDFEFTPDNLKRMDEAMVASGNTRWSFIAVEKATGKFAGWTDIVFNPSKPNICDVGGTAVSAEYQNLGLGRWLKAAILDKLVREKPEIIRVRTGNAHSNAPMLKINDELGFKPALTMNLWQVETATVKEFAGRQA